MQRAQRAVDNPALDVAVRAANELRLPLAVFFGLHPNYPGANLRHYAFLLEGLEETARGVERRGAAFILRSYPRHDLLRFCDEVRAALVIGDENPLREPESWRRSASKKLNVPLWTVDADTVAPTKLFAKEEYAARTLRPKIRAVLDVFLQPLEEPLCICPWPAKSRPEAERLDAGRLLKTLPLDRGASAVSRFKGGTAEGLRRLRLFIDDRLSDYPLRRNLPQEAGTSELSAYLHFGHLGPLTIALAVKGAGAPEEVKRAYLEELIVRRELSINYVARNANYDSLGGSPDWARATLDRHRDDIRPHIYSRTRLEESGTHDPLWNAAQLEMTATGYMHGYLRMYWAKKILEWSETPEEAFATAVCLNDKYFLCGRDPNGYTGIAWAIGGKHDRPWGPRRPVFGTVRYMSAAGMARKFDVKAYIARVERLAGGRP
jgi:deoxyribodipyrimidine photo-lyase